MPPPMCEHPFDSNRLNGASDFRPDWDIPSAGRTISAALNNDIAAVRSRPAPDPSRRIHLIRGAAGYGKTHLFGRVQSEQGDRVQFVFVAAPPEPNQPTKYVCWQVVETLFHSAGGGLAPLRRLLAQFLRPSFAAYFDQLPAGLRAQTTAIRQVLEDDALAVLEVISRVTDLAPYHALADSLRRRYPDLSSGTLRALVLSLSPAADDARAWLRGEADQILEERLRVLRLGECSPDPGDVIRAVATLLRQVSVPLVLCLDQLDQLYLGSLAGFQELASQLMKWLQSAPEPCHRPGVRGRALEGHCLEGATARLHGSGENLRPWPTHSVGGQGTGLPAGTVVGGVRPGAGRRVAVRPGFGGEVRGPTAHPTPRVHRPLRRGVRRVAGRWEEGAHLARAGHAPRCPAVGIVPPGVEQVSVRDPADLEGGFRLPGRGIVGRGQ